ncbi:MAG: acetate--CoA ligase family protein, partial [Candidatus Eremiobacteraeota bacterium]|nr:acetate--CoA ligase family protein [Candidatus Eremiobacteraeota bacterium]
GGVRLGLRNSEEVAAAFRDVMEAAHRHAPNSQPDGVVVQAMIDDGVEAIVGMRRDPGLGPLVMVGLGGIFVEVFEDVAFRAAPINRSDAHEMLEELRGFRLLGGVRGQAPADVDALVGVMLAVSRLAAGSDTLDEIDLNPVKVRASGAVAIDALIAGRGRKAVRPNTSVPV